ncbi:hypothetical protein Hanom_Chr13g01196501 [Helianthus anomalus]
MMVPQSSSTSPFCLNPSPLNQSKEVLKVNISVLIDPALIEFALIMPKSFLLICSIHIHGCKMFRFPYLSFCQSQNNKWALQEQALFEMLQALREAGMLNIIICLKYIIPQV